MDALTLLTADHNRVRGCFARFTAAHDANDAGAMSSLVDNLAQELHVHTTIEEEIFYPHVRQGSDDLEKMIAEGIEEHHVVDRLLEELPELEPGGEDWVAKVQVMIENVEHHATEEEHEMFPKARSVFDADTLQELADRLEARKAELGAPTVADKEHLTLDELRDLAQRQEIPGRSEMKREELLATVAPL
jgi:hemerythrin-like domain-containing protein